MKILTLDDQIPQSERCVVTVGNFDGVHQGHEILIQEVIKRATQRGFKSAVVTFEPHTRAVLYPELPQKLLTTFDEKAVLMEDLGLDYLVRIPFDRALSQMPPEEFIRTVLSRNLRAAEWVMGEGHAVGSERAGGKKFLHETAAKYHIITFTAELFSRSGSIVSSTQIRKLISEGHIAEAVEMLGHPYLISAKRVRGERIGTRIGFPTLNFAKPVPEKVIPPVGVYAAQMQYGGNTWTGALYFGDCATIGRRDVHFEFHAFEFDGAEPPQGDESKIWIHSFVRNDKKFATLQELQEQIEKDIRKIRGFFTQERRQCR